MEFELGHVCKDCNHLLEQLDGLQFQLDCLKDHLLARVDKFWNSEIDYKSSRARADHQLVVRAIDGTVASGEAFAKKASKTISQTNGGQEEIIKKMAVISGPPLKGMEPSKALAAQETFNHRTRKLTKANAMLSYGSWTDPRFVEQALMRGSFDPDFIINYNAS